MTIELTSLPIRPGASPGSLSFEATGAPRSATVAEAREPAMVNISDLASLRFQKDQSIEAGKRIRQVDQAMEQQASVMRQMQSELGAIVKQYPPFASDDPQRAKYLEAFSGLRAQIEAVTWPKEPALETLVPLGMRLPAALGQTPPIPDLPKTASDADVRNAYASIGSALGVLAGQREALADSVRAITS